MDMEQRRYQRVQFTGDVLINESILSKGVNISEGGIYVHTGRAFVLGSVVTVRFTLGGRELFLKAEVKCCHQSIGMGLSFVDLKDADREHIRVSRDRRQEAETAAGPKKVLLVDDNQAARRMNKSKLVHDGFIVVEAQDGIEAVERLQADRPDIVVLDLYMEKMDGYKVMAYMKETEAFKDIPVLIFSARGTPVEMEKAKAAGADEFLVKMNTSPAKLSEHVKKLTGRAP